MRIDPAILGKNTRSAALVGRLARDFMRPHAKRIVLAFLLMGLAAGSTAGRAWLMEPVLDRIFVAREGSLLLLIAGGALVLALVKGLADYGEAVLMTRVGQRVIADVQIALFARLMRADLAYFHTHPTGTLVSRFTNDAALLRGAAAQRIFEVLDIEPTIHDMPSARPLRIAGGEICFDDVRFGYGPGTVAIE